MRFQTLFLSCVILCAACANQDEVAVSSAQQEAMRSQAQAASKELMSTLQKQLKSAIQKEGVAEAVTTCSVIAPAIASQVGDAHGLQIRRVSTKNRNPQGKPDAFEAQHLDKWAVEDGLSSDKAENNEVYEVVRHEDKLEFRYMKPIRIQQACLQCHGQSVAPQVQAAIQRQYPGDLATGYALNDLRGAVSVRIAIP